MLLLCPCDYVRGWVNLVGRDVPFILQGGRGSELAGLASPLNVPAPAISPLVPICRSYASFCLVFAVVRHAKTDGWRCWGWTDQAFEPAWAGCSSTGRLILCFYNKLRGANSKVKKLTCMTLGTYANALSLPRSGLGRNFEERHRF